MKNIDLQKQIEINTIKQDLIMMLSNSVNNENTEYQEAVYKLNVLSLKNNSLTEIQESICDVIVEMVAIGDASFDYGFLARQFEKFNNNRI